MQKIKNDYLDYFELIKYAIDKVHLIKNISEIRNTYSNKITDITDARNQLLQQINQDTNQSLKNVFIGKENYFFAFQDSPYINGEFSLDFLNKNQNGFTKVLERQKRLANFRIQIFTNRLLSQHTIYKKKIFFNKEVVNYKLQ
jgi:hypothetical protein